MAQIKKFIIRLSALAAVCLLLAFPLQWVVDAGLRKSDFSTEYKEWDDILNSRINADIIIQGSSKARLQISPKEFEKSFGLSAYNLGMDGQHIPMEKYRFDVYLKHNKKPKYVIQVISLTEMRNPGIYTNYSQFIPYLNHDFIKKFGRRGYLNDLDFYVPLVKYCHQTGMMETGLINFFNKEDHREYKYKGFRSANLHWSDTEFIAYKKRHPPHMIYKIDRVAYANFVDMIQTCRRENIDLILVYTPTPFVFETLIANRDELMKMYKDLADKYKLKYLDYSRDTIAADTAMFYNYNHLNTRGVAIFNKQLINDLKDEIK